MNWLTKFDIFFANCSLVRGLTVWIQLTWWISAFNIAPTSLLITDDTCVKWIITKCSIWSIWWTSPTFNGRCYFMKKKRKNIVNEFICFIKSIFFSSTHLHQSGMNKMWHLTPMNCLIAWKSFELQSSNLNMDSNVYGKIENVLVTNGKIKTKTNRIVFYLNATLFQLHFLFVSIYLFSQI